MTPAKTTETSFDTAFENSKARAVRDFPALGVAGSAFNREFLARVQVLQTIKSDELRDPNWPYIVAGQVHLALSAPSRMPLPTLPAANIPTVPNLPLPQTTGGQYNTAPLAQNTSPASGAPSHTPTLQSTAGNPFLVTELANMDPLPTSGFVRGAITKLDRGSSLSPVEMVLTLDGLMTCMVDLTGITNHDGRWEIVRKDESLQLIVRSRGKPHVIRTFSIGQTITVEGLISRKPPNRLRHLKCYCLLEKRNSDPEQAPAWAIRRVVDTFSS